jgi:NAD(P)-dependent dehydrogenase (short-subunit alcohol dehydrogenase family)
MESCIRVTLKTFLILSVTLQYQKNAVLPRIGTAEDIAGMVVSFLIGKDSAYITGQTIIINGGTRMD